MTGSEAVFVRDAVIGDFPALLSMGRAMHAESVTPFPQVEPDKVRAHLELAIERPDALFAALAFRGEVPIGFSNGGIGAYTFSSARRSFSEMLYVRPEFRGGSAAVRLVRHFLKWSEDRGAMTKIMGVSTGVHPERTGAFFSALGFDVMGATYVHRA